MTRKVWDSEADFDDAYSCRIRDPSHPQFGQTVGYGRLWAGRCEGLYDDDLTRFNLRAANLRRLFGIAGADRVLIVGCGLGFLIDAFHDGARANVWGVDSSGHVATKRSTETRPTTLFVEADILSPTIQTDLTALTGGDQFNFIVTESLLESYEDAEMAAFLDRCELLLDPAETDDQIIHLIQAVIPRGGSGGNPDESIDPIYQQKLIAEWKAIRPAHSWVDIVIWEVG